MMHEIGPTNIIEFWIGEASWDVVAAKQRSKFWYRGDISIDRHIKEQFGSTMLLAASDELVEWEKTSEGALALVILLDQFSRNCYRASARAYSNDVKALQIAKRAIKIGLHSSLTVVEKTFLYHPFHHSERLSEQNRYVELTAELLQTATTEWREFVLRFVDDAKDHQEVIARFGRFPHRNKALNRKSTLEEREYLKRSSRYGQ